MSILPSIFDDIPELVKLIESCYRGDSSRQGWTHEADLLGGIRMTPAMLKDEMSTPGAVILKYLDAEGSIIGCVYTEKRDDKLYTGTICVRPDLQAGGLGKKLMAAVEDMAKEYKCSALTLRVISRRKELIEWYERRGFRNTGETAPFPTNVPGCIIKVPLEFIIMQKDF